MTKKARFIKNMTTLSDKEKAQIIAFFNKYPNYENRIDWNKKELRYSDFEKVFALAQVSKTKIKQKAKENPRLLFEKYNCEILYQTEDFIVVVPLDHECAIFFNSFNCGGEGAKWCIGDSNNPKHWYNHAQGYSIFALVYFTKKQVIFGRKIIFLYNIEFKYFELWKQNNKGITSEWNINYLFNLYNFLAKKWTWIIFSWGWLLFRRHNKIMSQVFNFIQNTLPLAADELFEKIDIPIYFIKDSELKYWMFDDANIDIPTGVTSIGSWVLADNKRLEKINIPDGVTSIGIGAFSSCENLKAINIPDSVTNIECFAFAWNKKLETINIPNGVDRIEFGTFSSCENLKSINLPNSITVIEGSAFSDCKNLEAINLPKSLTYIGNKSFAKCERLTTITIPKSVNYIGKRAFYGCINLESVNIPKGAKIARNAFKGCKKLKKINRYGVNLSV